MKINDKSLIYLVCAAMFAVLCVTGAGCTSQEETAESMPAESIVDENKFTPGEEPLATPDGAVPVEMGEPGMPPEGMGEAGRGAGGMDFASAASTLGVTEEELMAALGTEGGPMDLVSAASALGITVEELEEALGFSGEMPPQGQPPA